MQIHSIPALADPSRSASHIWRGVLGMQLTASQPLHEHGVLGRSFQQCCRLEMQNCWAHLGSSPNNQASPLLTIMNSFIAQRRGLPGSLDGSPGPTAIVRLMPATVSGGHPYTPWAPCRMARETTWNHALWKYSYESVLSTSRRELGASNGMQRQREVQ